jgi:hypothetical protein
MNKRLDEHRLQQLVDGELSYRERAALLAQLDISPGQWRRLALAFVEAQMLDLAAAEFLGDRRDAEDGVEPHPWPLAPGTCAGRRFGWGLVASLAIAMCLGFALGVTLNPDRSALPDVAGASDPSGQGHVPEQPMPFEEALAKCSTPVADNVRRELLQAGFFVDAIDRITPVRLPTGENIRMPVREFSVRYLGAAVFQ